MGRQKSDLGWSGTLYRGGREETHSDQASPERGWTGEVGDNLEGSLYRALPGEPLTRLQKGKGVAWTPEDWVLAIQVPRLEDNSEAR